MQEAFLRDRMKSPPPPRVKASSKSKASFIFSLSPSFLQCRVEKSFENFRCRPVKTISGGLGMTRDFPPSTNEINTAGELIFSPPWSPRDTVGHRGPQIKRNQDVLTGGHFRALEMNLCITEGREGVRTRGGWDGRADQASRKSRSSEG